MTLLLFLSVMLPISYVGLNASRYMWSPIESLFIAIFGSLMFLYMMPIAMIFSSIIAILAFRDGMTGHEYLGVENKNNNFLFTTLSCYIAIQLFLDKEEIDFAEEYIGIKKIT